MIYKNRKDKFIGEWENDIEKNGEGLIIFPNNDNGIYKGKIINSKRERKGIM